MLHQLVRVSDENTFHRYFSVLRVNRRLQHLRRKLAWSVGGRWCTWWYRIWTRGEGLRKCDKRSSSSATDVDDAHVCACVFVCMCACVCAWHSICVCVHELVYDSTTSSGARSRTTTGRRRRGTPCTSLPAPGVTSRARYTLLDVALHVHNIMRIRAYCYYRSSRVGTSGVRRCSPAGRSRHFRSGPTALAPVIGRAKAAHGRLSSNRTDTWPGDRVTGRGRRTRLAANVRERSTWRRREKRKSRLDHRGFGTRCCCYYRNITIIITRY